MEGMKGEKPPFLFLVLYIFLHETKVSYSSSLANFRVTLVNAVVRLVLSWFDKWFIVI